MDDWTIDFYETADGYSPVEKYLGALQSTDAAQVAYEIDLLGKFSTRLGMPHAVSSRSQEAPMQGTPMIKRRLAGCEEKFGS